MKRVFLSFIFIGICLGIINAQTVSAQNNTDPGPILPSPLPSSSVTRLKETGLWNGVYMKLRFTDKMFFYAEHHLRFKNSPDNLYDFVGVARKIYNRWGLTYLFNKYFEGTIGPTLVLNLSPDPTNEKYEKLVFEPRIWHQWLFIMPPMGRAKVYHQLRFEHRWRRESKFGSPFKYTDRYRYKLFSYIPINKSYLSTKTWFLGPGAEIFMHSGKSIVFAPFEDFRIYNGIGYILNEHVTLFAGHIWTIGQEDTGFEYRNSHIFRINAYLSFDMRGTKQSIPSIHLMD